MLMLRADLVGNRRRLDSVRLIFDSVSAVTALALCLPVFLFIGAAIVLEDGWPMFFRQKRIGRNGREFWLWKFRSMRMNMQGTRITAAGDKRLFRVGKLLRKLKIDELPQLWNVVRGEMSLVGPRPEVPEFVAMDDPAWQQVLAVRPGITDYATLLYRNEEELLAGRIDPEIFYKEQVLPAKLALNIRYLAQRSFWRDLKVILLTIRYSFIPAGIDAERLNRALGFQ